VLAKLDRIFVSTSWEAAFPLAKVLALPKLISDHNPLMLDSGDNCSFGKKKFKFEKWWLEIEDFSEVVLKAWNLRCEVDDPMEVWQSKVSIFRRLVRGWASNVVAELNRHKQTVAAEFNCLDMKAEGRVLDRDERIMMKMLARELEKIWALKEIKIRQRSRDRNILEGDRNTAYFHAVANQRNMKKKIEHLNGPDGVVDDSRGMLKIAADFYKVLFA
jgi:hypothetical protein